MNKRRRYKAKSRRLLHTRMRQGKWIHVETLTHMAVDALVNRELRFSVFMPDWKCRVEV